MFTVFMIARFVTTLGLWRLVLALLAAGSLLLSAACQKVPLLAPTGSSIALTATATTLPLNGTTDIIAQVLESGGTPPQNGTLVTFTTSLGSIEPSEARTSGGRVIVKFLAGSTSGEASIVHVLYQPRKSRFASTTLQGAASLNWIYITETPGHTIVKISPAQLDVWKKAVDPVYAQWVKAADAAGNKGQAALDDLRKELANRKAGS